MSRLLAVLVFSLGCSSPGSHDTPDAPAPTGDGGGDAVDFVHDPGLEGPPFTLADPACVRGSDRITCSAVVYSTVDNTPLHVDLIAPLAAETQRVPAIVYLHPGGWSVGNYGQLAQYQVATSLAHGYATVSVEYRLTLKADHSVSGVTFPEDLKDVKTAIRWLRIKAAGFVDPDRILAYGVSAGAHLASLVATTPGIAEFDGRGDPSVPTTIKALVGLSTPIDFHLFVPLNPPLDPSCPSQPPGQDPQQGISWLMGIDRAHLTDAQYEPLLTELSMLTYMSPAMPPALLFAGTCDQTVPYMGAQEVAARGLSQIQVVIVDKAFHGTTVDPPASQQALAMFLARQLDP